MSQSDPTLGESPEASAILTDIKPSKVSIVDNPAIGEPAIVIKGLKDGNKAGYDPSSPLAKRGRDMADKLSTDRVPRIVMKSIESRVKRSIENVNEITEIAKSLKVVEKGNDQPSHVPHFLAEMTKSVASEIRSLLPSEEVTSKQRGLAESVLSIQSLSKRADEIEKAGAVSYLMRDQYVSVTQSVSEYLTTYVDGVEHDDSGPMLIPDGLDSTVDKSTDELEKLSEEFPVAEPIEPDVNIEPDATSDVNKLHDEIANLRKALVTNKSTLGTESTVAKAGTKMALERLKRLNDVSSGVSKAAEDLQSIVKELEDTGDDDMAEDTAKTAKTNDAPESTQKSEGASDTPETQMSEIAELKKMVADLGPQLDERFNKVDERLIDVEKAAKEAGEKASSATETVEKFALARADSQGGEPDSTTKTEPTKKSTDVTSFTNILQLGGI